MSPDLAAETGTHIGDGSLYVRRGGPHGSYRYDVTGHALEDQLYLFGTVIPTVSAAYGLDRPGFYVNKDLTWVSVRYQSKPVALFKHEILGIPNGRKTDLSIPLVIRRDARLMRHLARELLATDGLVGFYNTSHGPHKYPRIQIKMSASRVIEQLANYLRNELGISFIRRTETVVHNGWRVSPQHILQISRSEDIEAWREEIGFSNPSHISRIMVHDLLGECKPRTSIKHRLSLLCDPSQSIATPATITCDELISLIDHMRKSFGFPRVGGNELLQKISKTNRRLDSTLGRKLPLLLDS
jgi:hypothetical protein